MTYNENKNEMTGEELQKELFNNYAFKRSEKEEQVENQKTDYANKKTAKQTRRAVKKLNQEKEIDNNMKFMALAGIFFAFTIICLFTLVFLDFTSGDSLKAEILPKTTMLSEAIIVGPMKIKNNNAVYSLKISGPAIKNQTSYVSGEVLDQNKNSLFGFGDDVWDEEGVDGGYYWHESKNNYDINITFPKKGIYYFQFESEDQSFGQSGTITVEIVPKVASSLFFVWITSISFILFIGFFGFYLFKNFNEDTSFVNFGKQILKWIGYILLIVFSIWIETL